VVDDREDLLDEITAPHINKLAVDNYNSAFDKLNINENTYIVIVTRDHIFDLELARKGISTSARYIGVIGSKKKK